MSIQAAIEKKSEGFPIQFLEFESLTLDETQVARINDNDRKYLEQFKYCTYLSLNSCYIQSAENLPNLNLTSLSLCDNQIESLKSVIWPDTLKCLNLSHNLLSDLDETVRSLKNLALVMLDLRGNKF